VLKIVLISVKSNLGILSPVTLRKDSYKNMNRNLKGGDGPSKES
jgi:hypothetical protein